MQQFGWTLKLYAGWEKNLKKVKTVHFHLYNILKMENYTDGQEISGCQGSGMAGVGGCDLEW